MIDLKDIEFKKTKQPGGDQVISAKLVIEASMFITGCSIVRPDVEAGIRDNLTHAITHQVCGEVKDYMALMHRYIHQCTPDPRFTQDPELMKDIRDLQTRFNTLLGI